MLKLGFLIVLSLLCSEASSSDVERYSYTYSDVKNGRSVDVFCEDSGVMLDNCVAGVTVKAYVSDRDLRCLACVSDDFCGDVSGGIVFLSACDSRVCVTCEHEGDVAILKLAPQEPIGYTKWSDMLTKRLICDKCQENTATAEKISEDADAIHRFSRGETGISHVAHKAVDSALCTQTQPVEVGRFSLKNALSASAHFCDVNFSVDPQNISFTLRRFLCEYTDGSKRFVQVHGCINDFRSVQVSCGSQTVSGLAAPGTAFEIFRGV